MTVGVLFWLAIGGLMLVTFVATGARVFNDFSHYELEQYCLRRNQEKRFDQILSWHEKLALAAEALQAFGSTLMLITITSGLFQLARLQDRVNAWQFFAALSLGTLVMLVTTNWIPWAVARLWSAPFLFHTWRIWYFSGKVAWPLTIGVGILGAFFGRLAGPGNAQPEEDERWEEEVRAIVSSSEREGFLETDVREMIEGVIELDKLSISEIMTPKSRVDAIDIGTPWPEMLRFIIDCGRTRIPVFEDRLDNTLGFLFVKDLLVELTKPESQQTKSVRNYLREVYTVPESKAVDGMLNEFLESRRHIAIVVDEYHNFAGVVTIEDILEEIVGEIIDETDSDEDTGILAVGDRQFETVATTHIDEVNQVLGTDLPDPDDYDTIGGLILNELHEIPVVGQSVTLDRVKIEVIEVSRRAIGRVKIYLLDEPDSLELGATPSS